jgi:hypothetical protein
VVVDGVVGAERDFYICVSEYVCDICAFLADVGECGPFLCLYLGVLSFWFRLMRFVWLYWKPIIVEDAVDGLFFL